MMIHSNSASDVHPRYVWPTLILIILIASVVRLVALDRVPPGLAPDEASNGYDAYSILLTGRDQHGVLLPLVMRSFNDYRMPLFVYSAVPFVGLFGLTSATVRMTAAFWGIATVLVTYWLGARMLNRRTGLVAALFCALSAWHIHASRLGFEMTLITFGVALAVALLWQWQADQRDRWLILAGLTLGFSLYTYSTAKLLVPLLGAFMGFFWWRTLQKHIKVAGVAIAALILLALPMAYLTLRYPDQMQARFNQVATFRPGRPWPVALAESSSLFIAHFLPSYLFAKGDAYVLQHPPFGGQLYWVQAPLLLIGLFLLTQAKYRRAVLFIVIWLLIAAVPGAITEPSVQGTPHALRNLPAVVPFQLLTALGINWLWELRRLRPSLRASLISLLAAGLLLNAAWFLKGYFTTYPAKAAGFFADGMQQVIQTMDTVENNYPAVTFSDSVAWPYIYVLFFTRYDPQALHINPPERGEEMFAPVTRMGKYSVVHDIEQAYRESERGLFIGPASMLPDVPALAIIRRPANGTPMCKIVGK
jgi:4-amino-4-deoxy-L-arabinose transferase-like glycosyltransferase